MTAIDSKTATRFDVEYDVIEVGSSMGDGGTCLLRNGRIYHFADGAVFKGFGFPEPPVYRIDKTGTTTGLPCFNWRHDNQTVMSGELLTHTITVATDITALFGEPPLMCISIDGRFAFKVPSSIKADGLMWPDMTMHEIEHKIIDYLG